MTGPVLRVHADHAAIPAGNPHRFEQLPVVDHEHAGIGHEQLEASDTLAIDQRLHVGEALRVDVEQDPFRRRFAGAGLVFYMAIASLIMPGLFVSLGIGLVFQMLDLSRTWYGSALGAQLTWTLPYGLLIMFAVLGRFNRAYEEAASDLGATNWQRLQHVTLPIVLPGIIGVALFGFTLSYDEFPRTVLTSGSSNTLPLEIWAMTTDVTSPALFAVGTVTTVISFIVIGLALTSIASIEPYRVQRAVSVGKSATVS